MKRKINYILFILIVSGLQFIYAQIDLNKTAQSTMNFLLVGTSPKACAMGEAFTSVGIGSESMFYNPAGLTGTERQFDVNINYTQWIADINYLSGGVSWNLGNYGVVGINLMTIDYGVINGTSLTYESDTEGYIDIGELGNVGAYSIGLSYAKAISREFSVGGTIKLAGQNLGVSVLENGSKNNNANIIAFDAGIKYITGFKSFVFGMSIRNFSSDLKREEIDEQLPLVFSLGAAMNIMELVDEKFADDNALTAAVDFLHFNNYSERVNIGLEYRLLQMFAIRGGYQTNRDIASWSGGLGFNTSLFDYDIQVNYSYSRFEIFDNVNRLSINFSF